MPHGPYGTPGKNLRSVQWRFERARGGLAPWQERRAKERLTADLSGNLSLSELARACRLSPSYFSQAFRQTVGSPPHQWLLTQRLERAKQLLLNTDQSLCEIALATGFADQSHFTRVFSVRIKASPAAWRRAQKGDYEQREDASGIHMRRNDKGLWLYSTVRWRRQRCVRPHLGSRTCGTDTLNEGSNSTTSLC